MERTDVVLQAQPAALEQSTLAGVIACATKDIISKGMQRDDFEPILVAENVTPKLLEELSTGRPHSVAVTELNMQLAIWAKAYGMRFAVGSDAVFEDANEQQTSRALDGFISLNMSLFRNANELKLVVVELELSNRSAQRMREDFAAYFAGDPCLIAIVGVKMFEAGGIDGMRAAVVLWMRDLNNDISVVCACDFGPDPLTPQDKSGFEVNLELAPAERRRVPPQPVPQHIVPTVGQSEWERFNPFPPDVIASMTTLQCSVLVARTAEDQLYMDGSHRTPPMIRIPADQIDMAMTRLITFEDVQLEPVTYSDLVFDLSPVLQGVHASAQR